MTTIGPSSTPAVIRSRAAAAAPASAKATVAAHSHASPNVLAPGTAAAPCWPPKNSAMPIGVTTTTTSTRRYCMKATSRSSAPSSPDMPTIPEAPPAISPSAAVAGSSSVVRARMAPAARLSPSVPAVTSSTGTSEPATARSASACR